MGANTQGFVATCPIELGAVDCRIAQCSAGWRQLLECAGRAQRRRRFGFPARGGVEAGFRRGACAESKAAWRFASRRTPKCARPSRRAGTIPQLVGGPLNTYRRAADRSTRAACAPRFRLTRKAFLQQLPPASQHRLACVVALYSCPLVSRGCRRRGAEQSNGPAPSTGTGDNGSTKAKDERYGSFL